MTEMSLVAVLFLFGANYVLSETEQSCASPIYCQGELLNTVQLAQLSIFNDSKQFVDMSLKNGVNETLASFNQLMASTNNAPSKQQLIDFVHDWFENVNELEDWTPADYTASPAFLDRITRNDIAATARSVVAIWPSLGRKVAQEVAERPDRHSLISLPNGFIIPGGRFREIYYWDTYWIVEGLLLSEMEETVRGILENFLSLVERYGFIPNGSRVYYLNRSQPPMLTLMASNWYKQTKNSTWLADNIDTLEKEVQFFLDNRMVEVTKDGVTYNLAHYASRSGTPRPESYREDVKTCAFYGENNEQVENCYLQLKSGAESGMDFSSRWFYDQDGGKNANLSHINVTRTIPVDLNAFLCKAFRELSEFYTDLNQNDKAIAWAERSHQMAKVIDAVFYGGDGNWYDYDTELGSNRKYFYVGSFAPLWSECVDLSKRNQYGSKAAEYIKNQKILDFYGGIPATLTNSGEQWDYPNAWPPLVDVMIHGLQRSGDDEAINVATTLATRWIEANMKGFNNTGEMFEKYDATNPGQSGDGGEYVVQAGFGWTNGAFLSLINTFFTS